MAGLCMLRNWVAIGKLEEPCMFHVTILEVPMSFFPLLVSLLGLLAKLRDVS